jgi:hypothetical protein
MARRDAANLKPLRAFLNFFQKLSDLLTRPHLGVFNFEVGDGNPLILQPTDHSNDLVGVVPPWIMTAVQSIRVRPQLGYRRIQLLTQVLWH